MTVKPKSKTCIPSKHVERAVAPGTSNSWCFKVFCAPFFWCFGQKIIPWDVLGCSRPFVVEQSCQRPWYPCPYSLEIAFQIKKSPARNACNSQILLEILGCVQQPFEGYEKQAVIALCHEVRGDLLSKQTLLINLIGGVAGCKARPQDTRTSNYWTQELNHWTLCCFDVGLWNLMQDESNQAGCESLRPWPTSIKTRMMAQRISPS